jgi:ribose transport system permease protein
VNRAEARRRLLHQLRSRPWALALVVAAGLFAANEVARSSFAAWGSWPSLLADFAPFALAAVATTPQMLSGAGGVDISIGPLLNLVSVVIVGELIAHGAGSPWLDIPAALALGALVGAINGVLVGVFRYQAVLATLCGLFVLSGTGQALLSSPASSSEAWLTDLGNQIGPVPGGLILIMAPLVVWWILSRTTYLRQLYAVGGDEVAAYSAGVDVARVRIVAYTLGGLFAGIAGLALAAATQTGDPTEATQYTLPAIAAVALGGTSLLGGRGSLVGSVIGAAIIFQIQTLIDSLNVSSDTPQLIYGAILIVAIVASARLGRLSAPATDAAGGVAA